MPIQLGTTTDWTKSTHSANGACVEVSSPAPLGVRVRDSKAHDGPELSFSAGTWAGFVTGVRGGETG